MFYVAIGYALALAAPELPHLISDSPATSAQVEMVAGDETPQPTTKPVAVSDPTAEPAQDLELERAARDFRIDTYHTHRLDRETYDRHIAAGQQLYKTWQQQPGSNAERAELLAWYGQARTHARHSQPLPTPPSFLAGEHEMFAGQESDLPQVVVEFPAQS